MIDEYREDFSGIDDYLENHPNFAEETPPPLNEQTTPRGPIPSQRATRSAPQNKMPPSFQPSRQHQYDIYDQPDPVFEAPGRQQRELGKILEDEEGGFGFVKSLSLVFFSLIIIGSSFYVSFSLGKKIFFPSIIKTPVASFPIDEIPFSTQTSSLELSRLEKKLNPSLKTPASNYEALEFNRIRDQISPKIKLPVVNKPVTQPVPKKIVPPPKVIAKVKPSFKSNTLYRVIAGAFTDAQNAKQVSAKLKITGFQTLVYRNEDNLYRVQVGAFSNKQNAQNTLDRAIQAGYPAFLSYN